jgi:hypothetical protein
MDLSQDRLLLHQLTWGREMVGMMQGGELSGSPSGSSNPENPLDMRLGGTQTPSGHCGDENASP